MDTLKKQLAKLAKQLRSRVSGSFYDGNQRLGRSTSALVNHFRSDVFDELRVVLCPHDYHQKTPAEQASLKHRACQSFSYWARASASQRGSEIHSACYLVTSVGVTEVTQVQQIVEYADKLLARAKEMTPEQELETRVRKHDWLHHMSDDHRSWSAGASNWQRIRELIQQVGEKKARAIWQRTAPKERGFPAKGWQENADVPYTSHR